MSENAVALTVRTEDTVAASRLMGESFIILFT